MVNSEPTSEDLFREETARAYLLGELPEGEARAFEERALADAGLRDEVHAAEKDLIDEYVRGELSPPERGRFERLFLASERRRQSVAFAQAFNETPPVTSPDPAREGTLTSRVKLLLLSLVGARPALKFATAALALVVVAGASWLVLRPKRPADELARAGDGRPASREPAAAEPQAGPSPKEGEAGGRQPAPHPSPGEPARDTQSPAPGRPKETDAPAPPPKPRPSRTAVATFLLLGGTSRGEQAAQGINIGEGVGVVRLRLYLEGPAPAARLSARVGLRDGSEVLRREGLRPRPTQGGTFVTLDLPSRSLGAGRDYEITLSDAASPGTPLELYRFRVSAR
jgi:anti-sigma factor RsiW